MNRDQIDEVRKRIDIVDVISRYVTLNKSGKSYQGICPFHEDTDPSLTVNPEKKLWYCFGCGAGGDVFKFIMEIENLTFPQAVEELGREVGVDLTTEGNSSRAQQISELNSRISAHFHKNLLREGVGRKARKYLRDRGYKKNDLDKFRLGYALPGWRSLTNKFRAEYNLELLETAGLVNRSEDGNTYDRFRDRLIFPIRSANGRIIGFGGRKLDPQSKGPKYLNSPNTPLFHKGETLYGIDIARSAVAQSDHLLLVEGYTDVTALQSRGMENVVASLGTSLTENQSKMIKRYAEKVTIAFDRDEAGQEATLKGLRMLRNQGLSVQVVDLPEGKDPADIAEKDGIGQMEALMEEAIPFHKFYLRLLQRKYDLETIEGKEKAFEDSTKFLKDIQSPPLRAELVRELKDLLGVPEEEIQQGISSSTTTLQSEPSPNEEKNHNLTPKQWILHLLLEDKITIEDLESEAVLEALNQDFRELLEFIQRKKDQNIDEDEMIEELDESHRQRVMKASLIDIPGRDENWKRIFNDITRKLRLNHNRKKRERLKKQLKEKVSEGANKEELEEIQSQILEQTRKIHKEV